MLIPILLSYTFRRKMLFLLCQLFGWAQSIGMNLSVSTHCCLVDHRRPLLLNLKACLWSSGAPHPHAYTPHPSLQLQAKPRRLPGRSDYLLGCNDLLGPHHTESGSGCALLCCQGWRGWCYLLRVKSRTIKARESVLVFPLETEEQTLLTHQSGKSPLFLVMVPESLWSHVWENRRTVVGIGGRLVPAGGDNGSGTQSQETPAEVSLVSELASWHSWDR